MKDYKSVIGENLKTLRKERKLSLDKVAALTNISKSMLSQIEKGEANPSISTLRKLTNGFKISFTEILNAPESEIEIIEITDKTPLTEDEGRFRNYPIVYFDPVKRFETYLVELDPKGKLIAEPHPDNTQEYITVFQGSLDLVINEKKHHLEKGDTIKFKADVQHIYENKSTELCTVNMIIYYPEK